MRDNTPNQASQFKAKTFVEIKDELRGTYDQDSQIRLKALMLRSSLCDYSNAYILPKGTTAVTNSAGQVVAVNNVDTKVIFKNCALFNNCISIITNMQVGDTHDVDEVMPMYNLIECSINYSKTSEILWQYCRNERALDGNGNIDDFNAPNAITKSLNKK